MRRLLGVLQDSLGTFAEWARKRAPMFAFCLMVVVGVMVFGHSALAAEGSTGGKIANFIAQAISVVFNLVGWLASQILVNAVIPILIKAMSFNNFINAAPVVAGWIVVRDFTNLLFILVLLVIAFGIIFGADRYGRIDMIPNLFIWAIAINFSRTIVGFLTDLSMIFMLTFTRAFEAAAAGNFVDLFSVGVSKSLNAESFAQVADAAAAITVANIVSALMLVVTTIILGYLAVMMMIRIVVIWILIVLAPLAWFSKIIESWGVHFFDDWWKELKAQLVVGPVMAFFIWLALATASGASADFVNNVGPDGSRIDANANIGFLDGATTANVIKAIIATVILMKGLEVAQHLGGTGNMLGAAEKRATGLAKGILGAGTIGLGGATARLGMRLAGGTKDEGAGAFRQKLNTYGNSQSAVGMMLADTGRATARGLGGLAAAAQATPVIGRAVPGLLQRKAVQLGASIESAGTGMVESAEKSIKGEVPSSPEMIATNLKQLMNIPKEARSSAQSMQLKELVKAAEGNAKIWGEFKEPADVMALFKTRDELTSKIKDGTAKREAAHHDAEFKAKNLHRLNEVDQQRELKHLAEQEPGMISKVDPQVFIPKKVKDKDGHETFDVADMDRATGMQQIIGADQLAFIMKDRKNADLVPGLAGSMSEEMTRQVAQNLKEEHVTPAMLNAMQPAQVVALIENLKPDQRSEVVGNTEKAQVLNRKRAEFKSNSPEEYAKRAPTALHASSGVTTMNLAFHVAAAKAGGGAGSVDPMETLGYSNGPGAVFDGAAKENFVRMAKNNNAMADWAMNATVGAVQGEPGEAMILNAGPGAFNTIAKRVSEAGGLSDEQRPVIEALLARAAQMESAGVPQAKELMTALRKSPTIPLALNIPKAVRGAAPEAVQPAAAARPLSPAEQDAQQRRAAFAAEEAAARPPVVNDDADLEAIRNARNNRT